MELNQRDNVIEIDIREIFWLLWQKKIIILLSGLSMFIAAVLISVFLITDKYEASTSVYILNKEQTVITYSDIQVGTQLAKDYQEIVKSRTAVEQVIKRLGLSVDYEEFLKMISVDISADTRILTITVTSEDPHEAMVAANMLREIAAERIGSIMDIASANVVDEAVIPDSAASPNVKLNALIAGIAGVAAAVFIILLLYFLDDTIKTSDDIERHLGVSVLGTIPYINKKKGKRAKRFAEKPVRRKN